MDETQALHPLPQWLDLLNGLVVTELRVEVVIADDFLPTEPAWRVEAGDA